MSGRCEVEVIIDGVTTDCSQIFSLKTYNKLFNDQFAVGTTANGTIDLVMDSPNQPFGRMATIAVRVRDVDADWEPRGTYYIDTRETIVSGGKSKLHIIGYDGMLKTSRVIDFSAISTWPSTTASIVQLIAQQSGIQVDTDTISRLNDGTTMPKPEYLTGREVLECIGAMHCGSFAMSNSNKLVFIDTVGLLKSKVRSSAPNIVRSALSATVCSKPTTYSRVELTRDENTVFTSGVATGAAIKANIPWATQELADSMCDRISGVTYQPYTASGVAVGALASLGDKIGVNESDNAIFEISVDYKSPVYATIAAPGADEVEHEFDYVPKIERQIRRAIGGVARTLNEITEKDRFGNTVLSKEGLQAYVLNEDGTFKESVISASVVLTPKGEQKSLAEILADTIYLEGKMIVLGHLDVKEGRVWADRGFYTDSGVSCGSLEVAGNSMTFGIQSLTVQNEVAFSPPGSVNVMRVGDTLFKKEEITLDYRNPSSSKRTFLVV